MKYKIEKINNNASVCLVYVDEVNESLASLIDNHFLEIVKGKQNAEKVNNIKETHQDALKFITSKIRKKDERGIVGIIGEFLFHSFMRIEENKKKFLSTFPTIGYSGTYQDFYKGFDGCYYADGNIWIVEIKSKVRSMNINIDNKNKLKEASGDLEKLVRDTKINRWERAKSLVITQLSDKEIDDTEIYKKLSQDSSNNYNKLLGTMLMTKDGEFDLDFIKGYMNDLIDNDVTQQQIFAICVRNSDYVKIVSYLEGKFGENDGAS